MPRRLSQRAAVAAARVDVAETNNSASQSAIDRRSCEAYRGRVITDTKPRIAIVGAGFGGIGMAIALQQAGIESFEVFERADRIGGVWRGEHLSRCRL